MAHGMLTGFRDRTVVVTGGSGVLCGRIARALGETGASVAVLAYSNLDRARETVDHIRRQGGRADAFQADVIDREQLRETHERIVERLGAVDMLVNGAGGARPDATTSQNLSFFDLPEEAVRWVFDLNFLGTFFACQEFCRDMVARDRGAVLNVASMGAVRPLTRSVAYSAAKAAVMNFTQWLAVHLSQEYGAGLRVNALVPGFFLTDQNRFLLMESDGDTLTERGRRIVDHTPMARLGDAEDLVGSALFLLSDQAGFVHGTTLAVDGGLNAYGGV